MPSLTEPAADGRLTPTAAPSGRAAVARPVAGPRPPSEWGGLAGLLLPAMALALWEALARAGVLPPNWLPAPSAVVRTVGELARSGELVGHLSATLLRVGAGFALGAAVATVLAVACGTSPVLRALLDPTLQALRNIPSMAWIPLFLLWLGIAETSKIALIALGAFFPVYLGLLQGILHIDGRLVEVGRVCGYRGVALARRVLLPAALPPYLAGLRGGLGLAWMFVVAAELMGASRGLGFLMVDGQSSSRADLILASLSLFAALGKATDSLLVAVASRLQPGRG